MPARKILAPKRRQHNLHEEFAVDLKQYAKCVARLRERRGFTRAELAEQVGISYAMLSHIENAENWPTLPVHIKIWRVLKCPFPLA